jgi:hypothetical protein
VVVVCRKEEKDWTRRIGNERHLICIEDPFETSHDLGRVVDRHSIRVRRGSRLWKHPESGQGIHRSFEP